MILEKCVTKTDLDPPPPYCKKCYTFFLKASLTKLVAPFIFESEHPILDGGGRSRKMKMESLETFFNFYEVKLYVKDVIGRFKSFCAIISQRLRDIFCPGLAPRSD